MEMETVMAPYKQMYKDMHRNAKLSKIKSFFTKSYVSPSAARPTSFSDPNIFQPGTPTSFQ
jgi:hypothetical protein